MVLHLAGALEYLPRDHSLRYGVSLDRATFTIHSVCFTADVAKKFVLLGQCGFIQISHPDHCTDIDSRAIFRLSGLEDQACLVSPSQTQESAIVVPIEGYIT